ncbi:hypothetical protein ACFQ9V_04270 [Leifsonia sp. NPDC056665]|uniref:hypothetical protein n=1 Tax=Leifsonia sp. NPDC056665 TaxID=3345901 RepID=UPI003692F803
MSDTSGLPNADGLGVPVEDDPERFEGGGKRGRHAAEPAEDAPGQGDGADQGGEGAEPPPADFDPTEQPSNPDLVNNPEPPDE